MASPMKILFFLSLYLSVQINARESRFFSKTTRVETSSMNTETPTSSSTAEQPSTFVLPPQSHNGYGHDPDQFPSENYNHNTNNAEPDNYTPSKFTNAEFSNENYENKESVPSSFTESNSEFPTDETYQNKVEEVPNYTNYDKRRYGMSDTRVMENGKYFYNVNAGKDGEATKGNSEGYGSSYGNVGGNAIPDLNRNGYGYKNDLEAYLNSKENQEDFVP